MASSEITVSRILELGVPLSWQECVAIASEVTSLRAAGPALGQPPSRIDAESCVLTQLGAVRLAHPAEAPQPDADLQLLRALLAGRTIPADLEQLAYGPPPAHLGDSLAMFSRPGRRADIAVVALRALAAEDELQSAVSPATAAVVAPPTAASPGATGDDIAQLRAQVGQRPTPPMPDPIPRPPDRVRQLRNLRVMAAVLAAILVVVIGYWATSRPTMPPGPVQPMPAALLPAELNDWWYVVGGREADIELNRAPRRAPAAGGGTSGAATNGRAPTSPAGAGADTVPPVRPAPDEPPAALLPDALAAPPVGAVPADIPVYSRRSAGVEPPVLTYPRMPKSAFPEPGATIDGQYLEVLVDRTGTVEAVRLRGRPATGEPSYRYSMLMAAAKAWQFVPARLAGEAVRYVTRVVLEP